MKLYNFLNDILKEWTKNLHTVKDIIYKLVICNDERFVVVTNNKCIWFIDKDDFLLDYSKTNNIYIGNENTINSFLIGKSMEKLNFDHIEISNNKKLAVFISHDDTEKKVFINYDFIKYFEYENMIVYGSKGDISISPVFFYEIIKNEYMEDEEVLRIIVMPFLS